MFKISILCYKNSRTWYHGSPLEIDLNDIEKHSVCSTEDPWEYITKRELKIEKIME